MLLRDEMTERRLFGAILAEPGAIEWCEHVETDDFSDLHLQYAFMAIRNLQARGEEIDLETVERELLRQGYQQVDIVRVGTTALEPEYGDEGMVRFDAKWLRRLANRRRNA
jgi:replicative DNA helicase